MLLIRADTGAGMTPSCDDGMRVCRCSGGCRAPAGGWRWSRCVRLHSQLHPCRQMCSVLQQGPRLQAADRRCWLGRRAWKHPQRMLQNHICGDPWRGVFRCSTFGRLWVGSVHPHQKHHAYISLLLPPHLLGLNKTQV